MHDSRPPDRTPVHHYTMKAHSRHSPAAGTSSYCHTATHPPRASKSSKTTTTPLASPRPPYSVGQNSPPVRSPGRHHDVRAPSPNYFGLVVESNSDPRESSGLVRDNWSPASASVRSFAAALPKQVSLEPNADFEAFRRQVDINKGKSFSLPTPHHVQPTSHPAPVRPRPPRWHTHTSDAGSEPSSMARSVFSTKERPTSRMDIDQDSLYDSAYVSADSKRNSEASLVPAQIMAMPTYESPRPMDSPRRPLVLAPPDARDPRMSLVENRAEPTSPVGAAMGTRAVTLPSRLDAAAPPMISGANLKELLGTVDDGRLLLLDIRSSQSFAQSRVKGALNLCIPTTLLKRPTFNIQKLQQTFQGGSGSGKFAEWRKMDWIVVYDAHASDKRDAVTAQNMIKKFTNEGFTGHTAILRGGFGMLQKSFSELIDEGSAASPAGQGECKGRINGGLAPVIGGVSLPQATGELDPFFANIRQNIDLADGVGQFEVARPPDLESPLLPQWLREAASKSDHGKRVSDKFLRIEQDEQARMRNAYAAFKLDKDQICKFQLSGVEKGGKNRYKDILPFDHARVRLQNRPAGACDYVNASHLSASRSHKRYIATQGPLPATFDDFWSVIWEQDVRVIVMLTAESEGGQLKCHPYWQGKEFGAIRLRLLSEKKVSLDIDKHRSESGAAYPTQAAADWGRKRANTTTTLETSTPTNPQNAKSQAEAPYVLIRKFALSHSAYPFAPIREITHLYFPAWPDFGTPAQPSHLLALVELANLMQRAALPLETASIVGSRVSPPEGGGVTWHDEPEVDVLARPMLVHCSAGCGRTGTFCAVDSVIDMLKRQRQVRLAAVRAKGSQVDTAMVDRDEELSPRTVRVADAPGFFDLAPALAASNAPAPPGSDPHWPEQDTADLVQKTVEDFREQRLSMVQSLRQYVLCYETILEWVNRTHDRAVNTIGGRRRSGSLQQARRDC
ncbi:protein-tyrosine phosphatase domain-containing protein [Hirsutella rhossiliensis]|uniref:protein-tyrosine-phosphatase n=1 Tax=Hirsutella rhossiliensis TaxID=111463 RepID=A0A9P8SM17_9HYPO|nr:protein-tyrosine phosphatase domain-containing protein [Hirsutella rhossiliensis]KAH0966365.1 protein-tyrosine phosphatase domain-containing protein [Hirsutella rhossiliensis]